MKVDFYTKHRENLAELRQKFPHQFAGENIGFAWPDSWHHLVARVCEYVDKTAPATRWVQIKEKYAGLRMYMAHGPIYMDIHDPAGLKMALVPASPSQLIDYIEAASRESERTCEVCSKPASVVRSTTGWLITVCPDCQARITHGH